MDDPAPVGGSTGADESGGEETTPASSPAPAAPVDTFEGPPESTPAAAPASKSEDAKPTGGFYGAAGADVERRLNDNTRQLQGVVKDLTEDPKKGFFSLTTVSQDRADLLGKVEEKSTGGTKDRIARERQSFDDRARANYAEFKRSSERQEQLKALPADQQKAFQAGLDRYNAGQAGRAAPAAGTDDAAVRRKAELQRTLNDSYTQLPDLKQQAQAKPEKALDYAHAWNKADDARRELGEPANRSWFEDKRRVINDATARPNLSPDVRQQLYDEHEKTSAAEAKDQVKQYDQDIADMKAGRKADDGGHAERMRAHAQDTIDRVEGKGPPTAAYQADKKQLDGQKADLDKRIAEEQAKSRPAAAAAPGTGGQPATASQPNTTLERLQRERAELDKKGDQLDRDHREALDRYAKDQADRASRQPRQALDGLEKQRADLDRQLKDPALDAGKRADLEKQRAGLDGQVDKARAEVKRAEQQAAEKVRAAAEKEGGPRRLQDQANALKGQLGDYDRDHGVPEKRDAVARAKDNQAATERGLEQAKKEQKQFARGELRQTRDGKDVPNKEFGRELDDRVDTLDKGLARDRAVTGRAEATLADTQVGRAELEAKQRIKQVQATAADIGTQRLGQRPETMGRSGFPADIERGLLSKDPQAQKDAQAKAMAWVEDRKKNGLGASEKAELKELGKKYDFQPHEDRGLYNEAKSAQEAEKKADAARAEAKRTAEEADKLEAEAKARGAQLPAKPTEAPPDRNRFPAPPQPAAQQPPPAAPQPAQGTPPKAAPAPEKERAAINPALSPEDRAHLERQQKELAEMGEKVRAKMEPVARWLQSNGVSSPANVPGEAKGRGAELPDVIPGSVKDAVHGAVKSALENPAIVKGLMEKERQAYGFMSQAAGTVGGLYELGEMGVKGVANVVSDPKGAAEKAWNGIKYAAENPGQVAKDAWDGTKKIATGLKDAVVESYKKDPEEFKGRAAFEVLSFLLPGAGEAGAAAKGANATSKAAEVLRAGEKGAEILRAGEKGVEIAKGVEKGAEIAKGVEKGVEVAKGVEKGTEVARVGEGAAEALRPGTQKFEDLRKSVEAKEELARRMRESLPGGRHEPLDGARGHSMTGRDPGMPPEMAQRQIAKLEKDAAEGRAAMEAAAKAGRLSVEDLGKVAEKEAGKLTAEQFTEKVMGYPKDITEKFTNGEIESARVYLGNEVKGNPLDPAKRFPQSDLIDALDEAKKGFIGADGKAVAPGELGRINFKHINGQLRGIRNDLTPGELDRVNQVVKRMDTMMEKSAVQEPTTVYRVTGKGSYSTPDAKGLLPPDKGFQSTGRTPQLGFAGQKEEAAKSILQIIEVPKGTKALDMDALTRMYGDLESFRGRMPHGVPGHSPFGENELLLARGTQLQVVDQWVDPATGLTIQRARVVPAAK